MSAPSAPQLVFEGPDPERLLLEAWSIHGTQVRITEPVIVRRGGIGGFFAKEHYRIEVLPAAPMAPHARMVAPGAFSSPSPDTPLLGYPAAAGPAPVPAASAPFEQATGLPVPGAPGPATSWALAELVAATEDEVDLHSAPQPSFEEILGKVAGALGDDPVTFDGRLPADHLAAPIAPSMLLELLDGAAAALAGPVMPATPVVADPVTAATPVVPAAADPVTAATPVVPLIAGPIEAPAAGPSHLASTALDRPIVRARPWTLADAALDATAEPEAPEALTSEAMDTAEAELAESATAAEGEGKRAAGPAEGESELTPAAEASRGRHARRPELPELDGPQAVAAQEAPRGRHAKRSDSTEASPIATARRPRHVRRAVTEVTKAATHEQALTAGSGVELAVQLSQVGFPELLLSGATMAPRTLGEAFELAPEATPLPDEPGSLVAIVGSPALARAVAEIVGLEPAEVARVRRSRVGGCGAADLLAQDVEAAAELAPAWRHGRVGVVAVAVGSPFEDGPWAAAMLRAMRPSVTLAAASAIMKADDVRAFCTLLGGVDALIVEDLEATLSPASLLGTGIPVALLEDRPAKAGTWAEIASRAIARRTAAGV